MNKHFDKFLLLGSIVALAAGVGFWHYNKDKQTEIKSQHSGRAPTGKIYESVKFPEAEKSGTDWKLPKNATEDDLWKYDLFSPIEVKWNDAVKKYEPKGELTTIVPFGIQLTSITHPVYRLTLRGLVEGKDANNRPTKEALIYDAEAEEQSPTGATVKGKLFRAKQGDKIDGENIIVSEVVTREVKNNDGTTTKENSVKVFDKKLNRNFQLTEKATEFTEITTITITAVDDPTKVWTLANVGDQIKDDTLGTFTLKGVDFAAQTVTIEKLYKPNPRKPEVTETKTLEKVALPAQNLPASQLNSK